VFTHTKIPGSRATVKQGFHFSVQPARHAIGCHLSLYNYVQVPLEIDAKGLLNKQPCDASMDFLLNKCLIWQKRPLGSAEGYSIKRGKIVPEKVNNFIGSSNVRMLNVSLGQSA
jgi:hypothetical protein